MGQRGKTKNEITLQEALDQQAATNNVLNIISRSPGNVQPVFDTIAESSVGLCSAEVSTVFRYDGEMVSLEAIHGSNPDTIDAVRKAFPMPPGAGSAAARAIHDRATVQIPDIQADSAYEIGEVALAAGFRAILAVPMLLHGEPIGVVTVGRGEPGDFHDTQVQLLRTFAEQAVIAIENSRLFSELRESLEFQKATNRVLNVISRSPGDVQPVFDSIAESAAQLCGATVSTVTRFDGEIVCVEALYGSDPEGMEAVLQAFPMPLGGGSAGARAIRERAVVQIPDVQTDSEYGIKDEALAAGYRAILAVPIMHRGHPVGSIQVGRGEPGNFQETQVRLLETFAEQAVIAIESARLFAEIQDKNNQLERQATELSDLNQTLESRVAKQVDELGRMSKLERFLSPKITSLIMAGEADDPLKTRRTEITVVYVDLRGFTAFTETTDPEEVMDVLREYHAELGKAIMAHDGTIEHFSGDGAMILFNAPVETADHELKAIRMTLDIRESIGALAENWRRRGYDLGFGAGIAGGYATLGTIGFEQRLDYSAIGTVCNLAARLCDEAKDGQILISPKVFVKVEDDVELAPVGDLTLKGFSRPVSVQNVVGLRVKETGQGG